MYYVRVALAVVAGAIPIQLIPSCIRTVLEEGVVRPGNLQLAHAPEVHVEPVDVVCSVPLVNLFNSARVIAELKAPHVAFLLPGGVERLLEVWKKHGVLV